METEAQRRLINNRTVIDPRTGCWLFGRRRNHYGHITYRGKRYKAHRFSWEIANRGPVPDGFIVCHRCDVPACVNPEHLFVGTQSDNRRDMYQKGRHARSRTCVRGHPWPNDQQVGRRRCYLCIKDAEQRGKAALAAWNRKLSHSRA